MTGIHIGFSGGFHAYIDTKQFLTFGITAAAFFVAGEIIAAPITAAVEAGTYATAAAAIEAGVGYSALAQAGIHAAAGAFAGGMSAGINGGDIGLGMLAGGISGGVGKYFGGFLPDNLGAQLAGRSVIGGFTGGIVAEIYGGDFGHGFVQSGRTAGFGFLFNDALKHGVIRQIRRFLQRNFWHGVQDYSFDIVEDALGVPLRLNPVGIAVMVLTPKQQYYDWRRGDAASLPIQKHA